MAAELFATKFRSDLLILPALNMTSKVSGATGDI